MKRGHRDPTWKNQRDSEVNEYEENIRRKIKGIRQQLKLITDPEEKAQKKARLEELRNIIKK